MGFFVAGNKKINLSSNTFLEGKAPEVLHEICNSTY
jgi:hypothetical protein